MFKGLEALCEQGRDCFAHREAWFTATPAKLPSTTCNHAPPTSASAEPLASAVPSLLYSRPRHHLGEDCEGGDSHKELAQHPKHAKC